MSIITRYRHVTAVGIRAVSADRLCPFRGMKTGILNSKAMTQEEINNIIKELADKTIFTTKEVLTSDEAAKYMGISKSYLYKLTMTRKIPHYKPTGKVCYFDRRELENFLRSNRVSIINETIDRPNIISK